MYLSIPAEYPAPGGEQGQPGNWKLRDVIIGIGVLVVLRNLPSGTREWLAALPSWVLVVGAVVVPQAFFMGYPLIIAWRRGIANPFRRPDGSSILVEAVLAVPVVVGLIMALIATAVIMSLFWPNVSLTPDIIQRAAQAPTVPFMIFMAFSVTLVAPVCEELFFRGMVQGALRSRMPVACAAVLQSAIFGALHTFGTLHSVAVFFLGLVLTLVYEWRKTLLAPIFVHAGNNMFAALCFLAMTVAYANSPILGVFGHDHLQGYQIDKVMPGAGASKAGIAEGDIITKLDDQPVTSYRQLLLALRLHSVGDEVTVHILRAGEPQQIKVVLEKRPAP